MLIDTDTGPVDVPLKGLSRGEWARLLDAHPGPDGWGPGLLPAVLAASAALDPADAAALLDDVDQGPAIEAAVLAVSAPPPVDHLIHRLRTDTRLRAEAAYCYAAGITREAFHAQPDYDQDLAVAVILDRQHRCPGCGVPDEHMTDRDAGWEARARQCVWCDVRHRHAEAIPTEHRHEAHVDLIQTGAP